MGERFSSFFQFVGGYARAPGGLRAGALRVCAAAALALVTAPALYAGAAANSVTVCDDIADPVTLDPHYSFDNKADNILKQVYEGLLELDAEGRLQPALAESWRWEGSTVVFSLARDVKFHNGEPFDAAAAAFSLNRLLAVSSSPAAMQIAGIGAIAAHGPYELDVRVDRFKGRFLRSLAAFAKIVPPKYFTEHDAGYLREHPVGTGPFVFESWEKGRGITLAANREYRQKGLPMLDRLVFRFAPYAEQVDLLLNGSIDLLAELPGTQTARVAAAPSLKVVKNENFLTPAFWFVNFSGPLADPLARRALNHAVNKDYLIRYGALGNGRVLASLSMPGETGHDGSAAPYPYDPAKARALLARARWPKDYVVKMLVVQQAEREARIIAENLGEAGVRSTMTVLSIGEINERIIEKGKLGNYDVCANLAPDPIGSAAFLAGVCFYGRSPLSGLRDPVFDALYEDTLETADPAAQDEKGRRLDAMIHERAWALFTYQRIRTYGMSRDLSFRPSVTGMLDFRDAYWRDRHENR